MLDSIIVKQAENKIEEANASLSFKYTKMLGPVIESIGQEVNETRAVSDRLDDFMEYIKMVCDEN